MPTHATPPTAIGHLDADCFYVSAERVRNRFLNKKPVGVLGNQGACVIAKGYEMTACCHAGLLDAAFSRLSEGGGVLMPLGNYGFSSRFGWLTDRFGVSWQLNLA